MDVTGRLGTNPAAVLVDGLPAEVIGGLVILSVSPVHTAEAGYLGVEAGTHDPLEFSWLLVV